MQLFPHTLRFYLVLGENDIVLGSDRVSTNDACPVR